MWRLEKNLINAIILFLALLFCWKITYSLISGELSLEKIAIYNERMMAFYTQKVYHKTNLNIEHSPYAPLYPCPSENAQFVS